MPQRILVVDDDATIRQTLIRLLTLGGYTVEGVGDGQAALAYVAATPPDLILLDVEMPLLNGFETCRRLKANPTTALIPITMLTGLTDGQSRIKGVEAGCDDFLVKPIDTTLLTARVKSQLRIKRLTDQLEDTERVIFTLALVVEAKDQYTEGHLMRLRDYGGELARAAGLGEEVVRAVRYGGVLHDIGKIGVSEAIIRKPGPLDPEEEAEMRKHPTIGAKLVAPLRFAPLVGPIVRHHHERYDGGGYPDGLAGEAIPIGARIIAIVDAYDAMTTDRPYRGALPHAVAVERLIAGRGSQFDPALVDTFVAMVEAEGDEDGERSEEREAP